MKMLRNFLRYLKKAKPGKADFAILVLLAAAFLWWNHVSYQFDSLFDENVELNTPYMVKSDSEGNRYVVDNIHMRVLKINQEGEVEFEINSNDKEADTITYIWDIAVSPEGDLFLSEGRWASMNLDREAILVYDKYGHYKQTCYDISYEDTYVDKHKLFDLSISNDTLYYVIAEEDGFDVFGMSLSSGETSHVQDYEYQNAYSEIYEYSFESETMTMYTLEKKGVIARVEKQNNTTVKTVLYDSSEDKEHVGEMALYGMSVTPENGIYVTDIKGKQVWNLNMESGKIQSVMELGMPLMIEAGINSGVPVLNIVSDDAVYQTDMEGQILSENREFPKSASYAQREFFCILALICIVITGTWCMIRLTFALFSLSLSDVQKNAFMVAGTVTVVTIIIVSQLLNQFRDIYINELFDKLLISAHSVSSQMDPQVIENINAPEDYMNEDYVSLKKGMESILDRSYQFNQEIYCNILKYQDGEGFSIAYLDQSSGAYYPLDEFETKEVVTVYETGEDIQNGGKEDVSGSYAYVKSPVIDKNGEVIAVVAIGSTLDIIQAKITGMQHQIIFTLLTIILIIMFLFSEVFGFFSEKSKYRERICQGQEAVPMHMVRLIIFFTFMAFNMATSFLPVYISRLVGAGVGIPAELAISLPISINLAFVGIMSLFCAKLMEKLQFKTIAFASSIICMCGDSLIFFTENYYVLAVGLVLNGIGVGIITNSINVYIASFSDPDMRRDGFSMYNAGSLSGINCGMMFGASLAGMLGQHNVFSFSAISWALVGMMFLILGRYLKQEKPVKAENTERKEEGEKTEHALLKFLFSGNVLSFVVLIQIPYTVLNSFVFYYVPLFGAEHGLSENMVCLLLMLNSLCSVYLSVKMTEFFSRKFKGETIYVSTILSLAALVFFSFHMSVPSLIFVLILLGISGSFGPPTKMVAFTELDEVKTFGEEKSMGMYNFTDNIGESAGPIAFGSLMYSANIFGSMCKFAGGILLAGAVYAVREWKKKTSR